MCWGAAFILILYFSLCSVGLMYPWCIYTAGHPKLTASLFPHCQGTSRKLLIRDQLRGNTAIHYTPVIGKHETDHAFHSTCYHNMHNFIIFSDSDFKIQPYKVKIIFSFISCIYGLYTFGWTSTRLTTGLDFYLLPLFDVWCPCVVPLPSRL